MDDAALASTTLCMHRALIRSTSSPDLGEMTRSFGVTGPNNELWFYPTWPQGNGAGGLTMHGALIRVNKDFQP